MVPGCRHHSWLCQPMVSARFNFILRRLLQNLLAANTIIAAMANQPVTDPGTVNRGYIVHTAVHQQTTSYRQLHASLQTYRHQPLIQTQHQQTSDTDVTSTDSRYRHNINRYQIETQHQQTSDTITRHCLQRLSTDFIFRHNRIQLQTVRHNQQTLALYVHLLKE